LMGEVRAKMKRRRPRFVVRYTESHGREVLFPRRPALVMHVCVRRRRDACLP
jgi:hypothetical protein